MKVSCCKKTKELKKEIESLYELTEKMKSNEKIYKDAAENCLFWLNEIKNNEREDIPIIAIKAINHILNNIDDS